METNRNRFRRRIESGTPVLSLGVYDALSAKIASMAGAPSVYVTGFGAAASYLGLPDIGMMTQSEMAGQARRITDAATCPVIADADTGYGGPANVWRTVREYESAGVAVIQIEDQVWPKRCGHMEGKEIVGTDEMIRRLTVAQRARRDSDFLIMARTDALAAEGFDAAVDRARRYAEAGADILFVEAPRTREELERIPELLATPVTANMVEGGKTPFFSVKQLGDMGYSIVLFPISTLLAAAGAVKRISETTVTAGTTQTETEEMLDFNRFLEITDPDAYMRL